ncbi:MAG: hypothetical protein P0S95_03080 [Rhabdochlamydiaceae bacterium]|nr:hypothetical protein [Candidatus Amphrikana amoebophyrae]
MLFKITTLIYLSVSCLLIANHEDIDLTQKLRIEELTPKNHYTFTLGIDPAIPVNYVMEMTPEEIFQFEDKVLWVPDGIKFKDLQEREEISSPILAFRPSYNFPQDSMLGFDQKKHLDRISDFETALEKEYNKKVPLKCYFTNWGSYPVMVLETVENAPYLRMLWVGLNNPDNRLTCLIDLYGPLYPNEKQVKAANEFWNNFVQNTKELPSPLFIKSQGQEMHLGYTIVKVRDKKAKVIAEQRKRDKNYRLAVIPLDEGIEFTLDDVDEGFMGLKWHHKEPLMKFYGYFNVRGKHNIICEQTTSVLTAEVDEFTKVDPKYIIKGFYSFGIAQ